MELKTIIILALIVETIVEWFKRAVPAVKGGIALGLSAGLGLLLAFTTGADVLTTLGLAENIPYVGIALTGVMVGGGSNLIFEFIKAIGGAMGKLRELKIPEGNVSLDNHEEQGVG